MKLGRIICKLLGRHKWRKARVRECAGIKTCRWCNVQRTIKPRVPKVKPQA